MMVRTTVVSLNQKGEGIFYVGDKEYSAKFVYPGDVIDVEISKKGIKVRKIVEEGEYRGKAKCIQFSKCGSCMWQGMKYSVQLKEKKRIIESLFKRMVKIVPSPRRWYYRNRMDLTVGKYAIGMRKAEKWMEVVDSSGCLLFSEWMKDIVEKSMEFFKKMGISHYELSKRKGVARYIVLREGKFTGDKLLSVVATDDAFPIEIFSKYLGNAVNTCLLAVNSSLSDVSYGEVKKYVGKGYLEEKILDIIYEIPPFSFFQPNSYQTVNIVRYVKRALGGGKKIIDLYSGVGTFSLQIAELSEEVVGVEEDSISVMSAERNCIKNGIDNINFINGKAEDVYLGKADAVILDPPRAGVHKRVIQYLNRFKPNTIIYISCNPYTQIRDVKRITGYEIEKIRTFDMFPHTQHIENVVVLRSV